MPLAQPCKSGAGQPRALPAPRSLPLTQGKAQGQEGGYPARLMLGGSLAAYVHARTHRHVLTVTKILSSIQLPVVALKVQHQSQGPSNFKRKITVDTGY